MTHRLRLAGLIVIAFALQGISKAFGQSLTIADLAAYRVALQPSSKPTQKKTPTITFRELWDHPKNYEGKHVGVEGRLARRFRQAKVGDFPALSENWIFNQSGDPICLVHPATSKEAEPKLGDTVRFEGTYLRTISYQGGDVARLAPLIVGSASPVLIERSAASKRLDLRDWNLEWPIGLAAAGFVALAIGKQHLKFSRPKASESTPWEPPPEFVNEDEHPEI